MVLPIGSHLTTHTPGSLGMDVSNLRNGPGQGQTEGLGQCILDLERLQISMHRTPNRTGRKDPAAPLQDPWSGSGKRPSLAGHAAVL